MVEGMKGIERIFLRLIRPLEFASRNRFANLRKIKGLEETLKAALDDIKGLIPEEALEELKYLIQDLETSTLEEKKQKLTKILRIAESIKESLEDNKPKVKFPPYPDLSTYCSQKEELAKPVQFLKSVGPRVAAKLATKNIHSIEDLLYFLPKGYEDRRTFIPLQKVRVGERVTVRGEIIVSGPVTFKRRKVFEIIISDGRAILAAKWFHFNERKFKEIFRPGKEVILCGEVSFFAGRKEIIHPEVEFPEEQGDLSLHVGRILPIYPSIDGLSPKVLRRIISYAVEEFASKLVSFIPHEILRRRGLLPPALAIKGLHFPGDEDDLSLLNQGKSIYHKSLAFDEFFFMQLAMALRRSRLARNPGISFETRSERVELFLKALPFQLTRAQLRTFGEIKRDMKSLYPMNRLVQGDVGCGKTVVAFLAALIAIDNGYQVALMAPTEILAEQHYTNFRKLAGLSGVEIALLTGGLSSREKRQIYEGLASGYINFAIGTHALFQQAVCFKRLGLVIIDEQHRFGVLQRAALREKARGLDPDTLVMTATPIPRTLAMTIYGDLDVSIIDEMPLGRKPVQTMLFSTEQRQEAYKLVRKELKKGHRTYVVFPLVEESEKMDLLAATSMAEYLQREVFPDYKVGLLHGKMRSPEKERIMREFKDGRLQILVSTTVIEVGVDVPEATVMIIENAERFGLSQLHQLRGRVGRSERKSYCLLISSNLRRDSEAYRRLRILCESNNGFRIAEEDLKIRGPGELLGTRQSGFLRFRRADLVRDYDMLVAAREEAFGLIEKDPDLSAPEHQALKMVLMERWAERLKLSEVA